MSNLKGTTTLESGYIEPSLSKRRGSISRLYFLTVALTLTLNATAQDEGMQSESPFEIHGDVQADFQVYTRDKLTDSSTVPDSKTGSNNYFNFVVSKNPFSLGARLENYQPALVGYDPRYKGLQIANRYVQYETEKLTVSLGNFYEQFGNGLILRSYWDWNLGYDNSFDGLRLKGTPWQGIGLKGLVGAQRLYGTTGAGIVRGIDAEVRLTELFNVDPQLPLVTVGGSFVSKYQKANHPTLNLPGNVAAGSGRADISYGIATLSGEYVYKINDPQQSNGYIYKEGNATLATFSLTHLGIGLTVSGRRIDNMDFRSDRGATGTDLQINNIQALTPQFTYSLATMYPYTSQPNGEMAAQADFVCKVPRNVPLVNGTKIWMNYSRAQTIVHDSVANRHMGYSSPIFALNDTLLYQNANIELSRKFGPKVSSILSFIMTQRNDGVLKLTEYHGMIYAYTTVLDISYKIANGNNIKGDLEHLSTSQDKGNWGSGMLEYEYGNFYVTIRDDYNYGNPDSEKRSHYPGIGAGYIYNSIRASLTYGRSRAGVVCAGGVCRLMPSVSGLAFTLTTSF